MGSDPKTQTLQDVPAAARDSCDNLFLQSGSQGSGRSLQRHLQSLASQQLERIKTIFVQKWPIACHFIDVTQAGMFVHR
jgi:hypothetical protein